MVPNEPWSRCPAPSSSWLGDRPARSAAATRPVRPVRRHGGPAPGVRGRGGPRAAGCSRPGGSSGGRRGSRRLTAAELLARLRGRADGSRPTADGQGDCDALWKAAPGSGEIEPVGATDRNGPEVRFTFSPECSGRRQAAPGRGAARLLAGGRGARDRDLAQARLLSRTGPAADSGRAQAAAEPARRASGPDLRRGHRVLRRARVRAR